MNDLIKRIITDLSFKLNLLVLKFRLFYLYPNNNFIYLEQYRIILSDFEPKVLLNLVLPSYIYVWDFSTMLNDGYDAIFIQNFIGYKAYGYVIFSKKDYDDYCNIYK